jgi:hypothetical protein
MAEKPAPKTDDSYSEEETDRRMDATIRAMIGMRPKPHPSPKKKQGEKAGLDQPRLAGPAVPTCAQWAAFPNTAQQPRPIGNRHTRAARPEWRNRAHSDALLLTKAIDLHSGRA